MVSYLLSLGLIVFGLAVGALLKNKPLDRTMKRLPMAVMLGLGPIVTVGAFWAAPLGDPRLVLLPLVGVMALSLGGILGLGASVLLKHDKARRGALFVSASFTNLGSFGGLMCFLFFGEGSYAFVALYRLFEEFLYVTVGFPVAKLHGDAGKDDRHPLVRIATDPFILVSLAAMALGFVLHQSGIPRPEVYRQVNTALIPLTSVLLVIPVGYSMRLEAVSRYWKEGVAVSVIKFLLVPTAVTLTAWALGLGAVAGGLALKTVLVLSAMPPAFYSLIPPRLYGLDQHLANSCWIVATAALVVVVPVLGLVLGLL